MGCFGGRNNKKHKNKHKILNIAPRATVSDKKVKCKQSGNRVNKGQNHTKVISSPSKRKEMLGILVSKQVLLSEKRTKVKLYNKIIKL